mgnify:CR=1 FL=1
MAEVLEALAEVLFGVTGMLALHLFGARGRARSDAVCIVVGVAIWGAAGGAFALACFLFSR